MDTFLGATMSASPPVAMSGIALAESPQKGLRSERPCARNGIRLKMPFKDAVGRE